MPTLQNGRHSSSTGHHRRRWPYSKIRFERRVRGRTNARRIKAFPFISSQGCRLPISLTGFRVECGSESLLKTDAVCSGTTPKIRYSLSLLSGQHLPLGKIDERNKEDYQNSSKSFNITEFLDKLEKECANSITITELPRLQFQYKIDENQGPSGEVEQNYTTFKTDHEIYNHQILPLGGKPDCENDVSSLSLIACSTCSTSSTGPNEEPKTERQQELKKAMTAF
jgi:hypothetical protein